MPAFNERPTHLDLFSGIGGFALAAQWAGFRTIGFCEIDKYCRKVLAKNFNANTEINGCGSRRQGRPDSNGAGKLEPTLCDNIFDLNGRDFADVSLITGGFPCQPFSVAGKRRGAADDRAIWPQMWRVIAQARPAWVLGENVPGIIPMELDNVLSDLEGIGYATRAFVIPACAVDARHRRDRLWIVGRRIVCDSEQGRINGLASNGSDVADSERGRQSGQRQSLDAEYSAQAGNRQATESFYGGQPCVWLPEPDVGRVAHGIPSRVDRLKGLGNAIVPQVAYEILREMRKLIVLHRADPNATL